MIIDTGILIAAVDSDEPAHEAAVEILGVREPRVVPESVVVEADWLIAKRFGVDVEMAFLRGLDEGSLVVEPIGQDDRVRAAEIIARYRDLDLGYVDATIVALAERLGERRIATLDRRHFRVIQPRHVKTFELLP